MIIFEQLFLNLEKYASDKSSDLIRVLTQPLENRPSLRLHSVTTYLNHFLKILPTTNQFSPIEVP